MDNVREFSNGENAASFFQEKIVPNGLYLLDEPENSLSAQRQIELVAFIEDMTRYEHCQFVIATHSPFVLSIKEAKDLRFGSKAGGCASLDTVGKCSDLLPLFPNASRSF